MRTGRILSINYKAGVGLISDFNGERIQFFTGPIASLASRGDLVTFEICFVNGSLGVVGVAVLKLSDDRWADRRKDTRIISLLG